MKELPPPLSEKELAQKICRHLLRKARPLNSHSPIPETRLPVRELERLRCKLNANPSIADLRVHQCIDAVHAVVTGDYTIVGYRLFTRQLSILRRWVEGQL